MTGITKCDSHCKVRRNKNKKIMQEIGTVNKKMSIIRKLGSFFPRSLFLSTLRLHLDDTDAICCQPDRVLSIQKFQFVK